MSDPDTQALNHIESLQRSGLRVWRLQATAGAHGVLSKKPGNMEKKVGE